MTAPTATPARHRTATSWLYGVTRGVLTAGSAPTTGARAGRYDLRVLVVAGMAAGFAAVLTGGLAYAGIVASVAVAAFLILWAVDVLDRGRPTRVRWLAWVVVTVTLVAMLAVVYQTTLARL